jgi:tRNA dimethylallyltransferase
MGNPTIYAIGGPTASGKTALAIEIAQTKKSEIVSFDSRQLYRELKIGVARPTEVELLACKHHGIANCSIQNPMSAGEFARQFRPVVEGILERTGSAVLVGGTGLYLKHLLYCLDDIPPIADSLRLSINAIYDNFGLDGLQQRLHELDANAHLLVDWQNPARLKRAIELCVETGKTLEEIHLGEKRSFFPNVNLVFLGIEFQRDELYKRIDRRVDQMMQDGLLEEVQSLVPFRDFSVLKTVGYSELFQFLDGELTLPEAIDKVKQHTRNYAKRQITYFRHQFPTQWVNSNPIIGID